jgi:holo-[acyl-carrier protein] synthase
MTIIGTGIDIVDTARVASAIERHGSRFLARIFTEGETHYCGAM